MQEPWSAPKGAVTLLGQLGGQDAALCLGQIAVAGGVC